MTVLRSRNDVNLLVCFIHMFFSLDFYTFELKKEINVKNIILSVEFWWQLRRSFWLNLFFFLSRGRIWTKIWTDFKCLTEHFAILIDAQYIQCWQWGMEQLEDILTWIVWIIDKCQGSLSPQLKWMLNQKRAIKLAFFYDGAKFCFFFVTFKLPMTKFVIQTKIDHNTIEIYILRDQWKWPKIFYCLHSTNPFSTIANDIY